MCSCPMKRVTCTLYSTWCIMMCLVIPILSLLLFIQSLYSLSKLQIFSFTCIYSTWCIMICLVIPILSFLLLIQSLYALSKVYILYMYICLSRLCHAHCPGSSRVCVMERLNYVGLNQTKAKGLLATAAERFAL